MVMWFTCGYGVWFWSIPDGVIMRKRKRREMKGGLEVVMLLWRDNDAGDECYVGVCFCRCVRDMRVVVMVLGDV